MWTFYFWLMLSWFLGLALIYGIKYFKDPKEFDGWQNVGEMLTRLFIGSLFCLIISLAGKYPFILYVFPGAVAMLSNYWMPWLLKKLL